MIVVGHAVFSQSLLDSIMAKIKFQFAMETAAVVHGRFQFIFELSHSECLLSESSDFISSGENL